VSPLLFGLELAYVHVWASRHLIVTEGPFDAVAARQAGGRAVVATLSANPGQGTIRWVRRLAQRITALYDMDDAGRRGIDKLRKALPGVLVSAPSYGAHDPWDLWISKPAVLTALVRS
jgi:DNA primase